MGDGMIDAACGAIQRAAGVEARLVKFNVSSVTGGSDALGRRRRAARDRRPARDGPRRGVDVVEASARAYLAAINRALPGGDRHARARRSARDGDRTGSA